MTIQFLILRIQSILDGKANASDAQLRAIASEYMRICQNAERKLLHCASLIRANRDYAAFQVAETQPMLLETLNELIFSRLEDWRNFCSINSLPCPSAFDENQISLVKSLYTREISQNHPLYRDYRRAMRMRNYEEALAIISTIVKVNGSNSEAKDELEKLSKRIVTQKFEAAKTALKNSDFKTAIQIASDIREYADDIFANDNDWKELSSKIDDYESQNAQARIAEILESLRNPEIADDFRKILAFAAEIDVLTNKFELAIKDTDQEFIRAQTKRALYLQDEANALEAKTQARLDIAAEIEHPSDISNKQALEKILKLKKVAGDSIEKEMAKRLSKRIASLRFKITMSRLRKVCVLAIVVCLASVAFFEAKKREQKNTQYRTVANTITAIQNMQNTKGAIVSLENLQKTFPEICKLPEFSDKIETIANGLELKSAYLDNFEKFKSTTKKFDKTSNDPNHWLELQNELNSIDAQANILDGTEYTAVKMEISKFSNAFSSAILAKRATNTAILNSLIEDAQEELAQVDIHNRESVLHIKNAKGFIEKAQVLAENPNIIFAISPERSQKLQEILMELDDKSALIDGFDKAMSLIKNATSAEEFFEALKELSKYPALPASDGGNIEKILAVKDSVLFEVYGGIIDKDTAEEAPETFSAPSINFYDIPDITKVYKAIANDRVYHIINTPEVRSRSWNGGGETIQKANVIIDALGKVDETTFSKITFKNRRPNGSILESIHLSKEAQIAENTAEISDKSLAQALVYLVNSNANPILKAWIEKRIFKAFRQAPIKTGFAFSKTLQERAKKIDTIANDFDPYSWVFEAESRINFVNAELYNKEFKDPMPDAIATKIAAQELVKNPMKIVGFSDYEGKIISNENLTEQKLYGITITGEFEELSQTQKPAKFSPIFTRNK